MDNSKTTEKNDCSTEQQSNNMEFPNPNEDLSVDIINCSDTSDESEDKKEVLSQGAATSSSSSSFDDSISDFSNSDLEDEAQSMLSNDYPLFNESENLGLRKRKMNKHFRDCIRPITWRTKWAEIKVKELYSILRKNRREIESYSQAKNSDLEKSKLEGYEGRILPFPYHNHKTKLYKRQRRRKVEETVDLAAYTSNHSLFSYYETRIPPSCKARYPDPDHGTGCKTTMKEGAGIEDDFFYPKIYSYDDELVGRILCKIDALKERTKRHKKRIDLLIEQESTSVDEISKECVVSTDHTQDLEVQVIQKDFRVEEMGELYMNSNSPNIRDLILDDSDMNYDDETIDDGEKLDYFRKLINSITGVPEGESDAEKEDSAKRVASKKRKK